jgi:hypothetical protein
VKEKIQNRFGELRPTGQDSIISHEQLLCLETWPLTYRQLQKHSRSWPLNRRYPDYIIKQWVLSVQLLGQYIPINWTLEMTKLSWTFCSFPSTAQQQGNNEPSAANHSRYTGLKLDGAAVIRRTKNGIWITQATWFPQIRKDWATDFWGAHDQERKRRGKRRRLQIRHPNAPIPRNDLKKKHSGNRGRERVVHGEARQASRHSHDPRLWVSGLWKELLQWGVCVWLGADLYQ